jgi:hypothetical protein
MVAIS